MHATSLRPRLGIALLGALAAVIVCGLGATRAAPAGSRQAPPTFDAVPGQVIVRYAPSTSRHEQSAIAVDADAHAVRSLGPRTKLVQLPRGASVADAVRKLERQPGVLSAEPNYVLHTLARPTDSMFDQLWGLDNVGQAVIGHFGTADADVDAPEAWDLSTGSSSVVVGVLDTGVAYDHPDLEGQIATNPGESGDGKETDGIDNDGNGYVDDYRGWDFADDDNDPYDLNNHGTHVSGTIGARADNAFGVAGINWNVGILPVRFLDAAGYGTTADLVDALTYIGRQHIPIVNGSFGGGPSSPATVAAIRAAADTLFVFAAANNSMDNDRYPAYPCSYPEPNIICVAATDQRDRLAAFSNYGRRSVDVAAPGVDVLSTIARTDDGQPGGYDYYSGTSMATPHVAGIAALALAFAPGLSPTDVKAAIMAGAEPLPTLTGRVVTGARANAERTLEAAYLQVGNASSLRLDPATGQYVTTVHVTLSAACPQPCSLDSVELRSPTRSGGFVVLGRRDGLALAPGSSIDVDVPVSKPALLRTAFAKQGASLVSDTRLLAQLQSQGRMFDPAYAGNLSVSARSVRNGTLPGLRPILRRAAEGAPPQPPALPTRPDAGR
jgi:subtilisin family serine protease